MIALLPGEEKNNKKTVIDLSEKNSNASFE